MRITPEIRINKEATKITMNILDSDETKEHIYENGLPSRKGKILVPNPKPLNKKAYQRHMLEKRIRRPMYDK